MGLGVSLPEFFFFLSWGRTADPRSKKHGEQKNNNFFGFPWGFCKNFLEKQTRMGRGGSRKRMRGGRDDGGRSRKHGSKKWEKQFFWFATIPENECEGEGGKERAAAMELKTREQKKSNFFCLHGSRKTNAGGWGGAATLENTRAGGDNRSREIREKKMQFFFVFLGVFVWIFSEIKRG